MKLNKIGVLVRMRGRPRKYKGLKFWIEKGNFTIDFS